MSTQNRDGRHVRLSPRLPRSVEGLLEALRALDDGDSRPLEAWDRERFPILRSALRAWARDPAMAERLACRIVREAFSALRAGRDIRWERSWMAATARRGRAEIREREQPIGDPLPADLRASQGEPIDELIRLEECERVRRLIAALPTKHRLALTHRYRLDRTNAEVAAYMKEHFRVGIERTRQILAEGRAMVKAGLAGRKPRVVHPSRYARERKKREFPTPLRAFPELHGWRAIAQHSTRPHGEVRSKPAHTEENLAMTRLLSLLCVCVLATASFADSTIRCSKPTATADKTDVVSVRVKIGAQTGTTGDLDFDVDHTWTKETKADHLATLLDGKEVKQGDTTIATLSATANGDTVTVTSDQEDGEIKITYANNSKQLRHKIKKEDAFTAYCEIVGTATGVSTDLAAAVVRVGTDRGVAVVETTIGLTATEIRDALLDDLIALDIVAVADGQTGIRIAFEPQDFGALEFGTSDTGVDLIGEVSDF